MEREKKKKLARLGFILVSIGFVLTLLSGENVSWVIFPKWMFFFSFPLLLIGIALTTIGAHGPIDR